MPVNLKFNYEQILTDADLFADSVKLTQIKKEITSKEPPVMVSNVNYGKRLVACIKTDDMSFDLKTTVKASGLGGKVKGEAEAEVSEKLKNCSVRVFTIGGSSEISGKYLNVSVDELMEMAAKNTKYDGYAEPISYTTRWATDGTIAQSNYIGVQWEAKEVKKLTDTIPVSFTFSPCRKSEITGIDLLKGIVKIYGRRITGLNQDGSYMRSGEQLILTHELDHHNTDNFVIPADVDAKTIRFEFDADYTNYFKDYDLVKRTETQRTLTMDEITRKLKENGLTECKGFNIIIQGGAVHRTKNGDLSYVAAKVLPIVPDYKYDNTRLELVAGITNSIAKK